MKKSNHVLLLIALFTLTLASSVFFAFRFDKPQIEKVLESEAYSYLSKEAKEYVENVYKETGKIIYTEKNKEENAPYLNPSYIEYLSASEEERKQYTIIPVPYLLEFSSVGLGEEVNASYPTKYDLRSVNSKSYITPIKNQNNLDICWTFASVEQIESFLMVRGSKPYSSSSLVLSPRQVDYATSTDGIKDYTNESGMRTLASGGNFLSATHLYMNGLGLMKESDMPFSTSMSQKELSAIFNYNKSQYEANNSVMFPIIDSNTSSTRIKAINNLIKEHIMNYGGVYVETESSGKSCDITKSDGNHLIRVDNGCNPNSGHAMQVIGWDDNFTYKYCKSNKTHTTNTSGCSSSNLVSGQGAWLLRNSWGDYQSYVYLAYDSIGDIFHVFTNLSLMSNRTWDNNYYSSFNPFSVTIPSYEEETFTRKILTAEKLKKIKIFSFAENENYNVVVKSGGTKYDLGNYLIDYPGLYTIDVSNKDIVLNDSTFKVIVEALGDGGVIRNMISVFTSNVDSSPVIKSTKTSIKTSSLSSDYSFRLYSNTKNIPSGSSITYSLLNSNGTNVSSTYLTVSNKTVAKNDVNALVTIKSSIADGVYTLKLSYGAATESIPVQIGENVTAIVYYYANNGSSNSTSQTVPKNTSFKLDANSFTKTGYTFSKWNTKADGTGTSYNDKQSMSGISSNLSLYAQWTPISYKVRFDKNGGEGIMNNQIFTYDSSSRLTKNSFTKSEKMFVSWNTKADGSGTSYSDEQYVSNLSSTAGTIVVLYAQWEDKSYRVQFDSNGGTGTMNVQTFERGATQKLNANTFTRKGYTFNSWNTKENASGTKYNDKDNYTYNSTDYTVKLYAQWTPITYQIRFNSNGGTGSMSNLVLTYDKSSVLPANQFTRQGYTFTSWNTKADGTGTTYYNKASVSNLASTNNAQVELYAQWSLNTPFTVSEYTVDNTNHIIDNVAAYTTVNSYKGHFTMNSGYIMTISLDNKEYVFTGSISKISSGGTVVVQYTNVVRGDANGDGEITALDYVKVKNHIMGTNIISGVVYQKAADANKDSNISALDYVRIKNTIMNR